jgi:hypothetical protein
MSDMPYDSNYDLASLRELIESGADLGVAPYAGEDPFDFAVRVSHAANASRRRRRLVTAARIGLALTLAAFGISGF